MKIILHIGIVIVLISAITVVAGLFMTNNARSFETGAALSFYGFSMFVISGIFTIIAKIIVSQRE